MQPAPTRKPKPEPLRAFGIKLPASMRAALFDEAARQTSAVGAHVSAGEIVRTAIAGHFARIGRRPAPSGAA